MKEKRKERKERVIQAAKSTNVNNEKPLMFSVIEEPFYSPNNSGDNNSRRQRVS